MIASMDEEITPAQVGDIHQVLSEHSRYWGERDLRSLHLVSLVRRLCTAFAEAARRQGAQRLKAITSVQNTGSIAFHRSLGFDARIVEDYDGPGRPMVVFDRALPSEGAIW